MAGYGEGGYGEGGYGEGGDTLGVATEVDTAPALLGRLGVATEVDTAPGLIPVVGQEVDLPPAVIVLAGCQGGYFDLPPEMFLTLLDDSLDQAPTALVLTLSMALPGEVVFDIDDIEVWIDEVGYSGELGPLSVAVPDGLMAGTHVLTATTETGEITVSFTLVSDPDDLPALLGPDDEPILIPDSEGRWVLQDLMPEGLGSWVMELNPVSAAPIPRTRNLQANPSTRGRFHVTEGDSVAQDWSFTGYSPDQDFYDHLVAYATARRRMYVIDDRGRAWRVAFLGVEMVPRKRQVGITGALTDWGHDYTMRCAFYDEDYLVPQEA